MIKNCGGEDQRGFNAEKELGPMDGYIMDTGMGVECIQIDSSRRYRSSIHPPSPMPVAQSPNLSAGRTVTVGSDDKCTHLIRTLG